MDSGLGGAPGCLSNELLVRLSEGRLSPEELSLALRHAAGCNTCHDDIAAVVHAPWEPPAEIDEFRIECELGYGGMGVVYLAHDTALQRKVAIKFIAQARPEPRIRSSFENEARLLARLQHPNIVTVFRVGQVEGHPYIVSEYVAGRSLAKLSAPLPWPHVLALGGGLARGLAAAHRQGVLHRDIKPSNAIEAEDGVVKLLDFGLAQRIGGDLPAGVDRERAPAGTPRYMAPEVRAGGPATPRSDLYSLGLVLHELCMGQLALDQAPAPQERASGPVVDLDLRAIIERCTRQDPEERFASADLLAEALERLAAAVPPALSANPYLGLAPFETEHQALFFGRGADIQRVLERLDRQRLVLVVADSGVGKSSLCRAGILPRVAAGAIAEGRPLAARTLTPGRRPLQALAAAFAPSLSPAEMELFSWPAEDPRPLGRCVRRACEQLGGALLFVDQLEELVTLSDPAEAACFTRVLGELIGPATPVRLLMAVRGDFFTRVAVLPGLEDEAERALYFLRPLSPEGLREAIVGPARACKVAFESDALVLQLVESAAHGSGELPLLSFALTELWEKRDVAGARITRAALDGMGGVAGLLSRHADSVLARLDQAQQQAARRLLIRLVTAQDTRGERREEELEVGSEDARVALRTLVEGRLLLVRSVAGRACYQIAHDALIQRWTTLRHWLDDDIGHRAVRQRLEAASAEWSRLQRPPELLWQGEQLEEVGPLDPRALGALEREFLSQSRRRALRRRRWRWFAGVSAALVPIALYGGFRLQAYLADTRFVDARLREAGAALGKGKETARLACERRGEALALFDPDAAASGAPAVSPGAPSRWSLGEDRWASALSAYEQAGTELRAAEQLLQRALEHEARRPVTHQALRDASYAQLELEECFHPQGARAESVRRLLQRYTDEEWQRRVTAPADLRVVTRPAGARVEIERYVDVNGGLRLQPVTEAGAVSPTPADPIALPPGSYRLRLVKQGRVPVVFPVLLARGARERIDVPLPGAVPEGFAFVPPGCFLQGSDAPEQKRRDWLQSAPLHRSCMGAGYLIGKSEVTFGDWLSYLKAQPEAGSVRVLEQLRPTDAGGLTLQRHPQEGWVFSFYRSGSAPVRAAEGQELRYPGRKVRGSGDWRQLPLSGVSALDLQGYLSWLARSGRIPGARLCTEREWERAASGADGRAYPGGDRLSPEDADFDATYGREPSAFGPDPVGSHPASTSPFGLVDMAGNAVEMTTPVTPELGSIVLRGGGWYYDILSVLIANRVAGEPTQRNPLVGARVCASFPPPGEGPP